MRVALIGPEAAGRFSGWRTFIGWFLSPAGGSIRQIERTSFIFPTPESYSDSDEDGWDDVVLRQTAKIAEG